MAQQHHCSIPNFVLQLPLLPLNLSPLSIQALPRRFSSQKIVSNNGGTDVFVGFITFFSLFLVFICGKEKTTPFSFFLSLSLSKRPTYTVHSLHLSTHFLHPSTHHSIFTTAAPPFEHHTPAYLQRCSFLRATLGKPPPTPTIFFLQS